MTGLELVQLEQDRWNALVAADSERLAELFHEDLVYTHSNGLVDTKDSYIDAIATRRYHYLRVEPQISSETVVGDTGIVTGEAAVVNQVEDRELPTRLKYSAVWAKTDQGWKFICWHSCPVA